MSPKGLELLSKPLDYAKIYSYDEMPGFYYLMSVYVHTSTSEEAERTPVEAVACGRPIVGTPTESLPEWMPEEGLVNEYDQLVEKIKLMRDNDELYAREALRFGMLSLRWGLTKVVKEYDKMFKEVVG